MAGTIKTNAVQLGDSATPSQNFVWQTNVDGTAKLARGIVGTTTQDILTVDAAGKVTTPVMPYVGTAPIVESGSNANGSYTKWADGTMICTHSIPSFTAAANTITATTWTFPVLFYTPPIVPSAIGVPAISWDCYGYVYHQGVTTSGISLVFRNGGTTQLITSTQAVAVGRWKA